MVNYLFYPVGLYFHAFSTKLFSFYAFEGVLNSNCNA